MERLLPGDVLVYYGSTSAISRGIRLIQGNKVTHVSVVVRGGDMYSAMVAETDARLPVRCTSPVFSVAEARDSNKNIKVKVMRHRSMTFQEVPEMPIPIGQDYGYKRIGNAMINHLVGRTLGFIGRKFSYKSWFKLTNPICSTLVSRMLCQMSTDRTYNYDEYAEPDDFTTSEWRVVVADIPTSFVV